MITEDDKITQLLITIRLLSLSRMQLLIAQSKHVFLESSNRILHGNCNIDQGAGHYAKGDKQEGKDSFEEKPTVMLKTIKRMICLSCVFFNSL